MFASSVVGRRSFGFLYKQARSYDQATMGLSQGFNLLDYA